MIPAVEQSHIVGSLHLKAPKLGLLDGEGDLELLFDFMNLVPVSLRNAIANQAASELMLVDPVTRIANREGLGRDLDREIGCAPRAPAGWFGGYSSLWVGGYGQFVTAAHTDPVAQRSGPQDCVWLAGHRCSGSDRIHVLWRPGQ